LHAILAPGKKEAPKKPAPPRPPSASPTPQPQTTQ
jgi:hypothetical protein